MKKNKKIRIERAMLNVVYVNSFLKKTIICFTALDNFKDLIKKCSNKNFSEKNIPNIKKFITKNLKIHFLKKKSIRAPDFKNL